MSYEPPPAVDAIDPARLRRARNAVFVAFAANGWGFASWASRLPDIQLALRLDPAQLGTLLLSAAAGSVISLPAAGRVISRLGTRRTVEVAATIFVVGMAFAAFSVTVLHNPYLTAVGMLCLGLGMGSWDVAMNHEGAAVERLLGRSIMPWFHAAFSGATVVGALVGAVATGLGVPVLVHILVMLLVVGYVAVAGAKPFLPEAAAVESEPGTPAPRGASAWLEPRTLLIGLVVLVSAFTEGTANDWIAIALRDGYRLPAWAGVLGFATFLGAMTLGRMLGTRMLDRHGRVPVLYATFGMAVAGSLLVVFGGPLLAYVGTMLWGVGASLGFPVGMSAASDDPARAAARLSVVATIGYLAFLAGPPLVGYLGNQVGVLRALLAVGALLVPALLAVPATRERR